MLNPPPNHLEAEFPNLLNTPYTITSPQTPVYNCIAWAADDTNNWWWPDEYNTCYWPNNVPREETIEAFIQAYGLSGYLECENGDLETGLEKVALYALNGIPTHAARQLENGNWTSKLGGVEDIEHVLEGLHGNLYGQPVRFLKRPRISNLAGQP